jgi:Holliday junction resolvasome RuvABC DNA-binding subunit
MIELFLNAIPNVLAAMIVGTTAGGLVQACEEDIPKLTRLKSRLSEVMIEREVSEDIQNAFWASYDNAYAKEKDITLPCEEALVALGSSKSEVEEILKDARNTDSTKLQKIIDQRHH